MLINPKSYRILCDRMAREQEQIRENIRNGQYLSPLEYHAFVDATRDERMGWWREARYGMFIHYGLFSVRQRGEWELAWDGISPSEYATAAKAFCYQSGRAEEWVLLAKQAGMKYVVLTTRHHEGYALWDSAVDPYNSVKTGPHIDIVREFTDACRKHGMRIGLYTSVMDWHHPDSGRFASDPAARRRFIDYIYALNEELLTGYGKIDILWYDQACPLPGEESWEAHILNQRLRAIQPHLIINGRSGSPEDFNTPEAHLEASAGDWETCDKMNLFSWGYVDETQSLPWQKSPQSIIHSLAFCARNGGNYLLNIGPRADGSVAESEKNTLLTVGRWLAHNGEAIYGRAVRSCGLEGGDAFGEYGGNMLSFTTAKEGKVYLFEPIWHEGTLHIAGYAQAPRRVYLLATGEELPFTYADFRLNIQCPAEIPDKIAGISVIVLDFGETIPEYRFSGGYPHVNEGNQRYIP